jgi:hypothetical protein
MQRQIYVNIPVKDLVKTNAFFTALGFEFNANYSNEQATCMIVGENIFVMLLQEEFFKTFIKKDLVDAKKSTEVLLCINEASKQKVDEFVEKAIANGGINGNTTEYDFMYSRSFDDLDGHTWEIVWMAEGN